MREKYYYYERAKKEKSCICIYVRTCALVYIHMQSVWHPVLLQRVTRKSLYRFRTSLGGSSSAGCLSQHFVIMRIRLIPIKRNQKNGKKKENPATAHHIKHTTITQHSTPHYHHPNAPCYANTHYTDTQYSTTLHYIPHTTTTSHYPHPMLHQHSYTNTCYTFTLHSTHNLEPTGVPTLITQHVIFYYAQKTYSGTWKFGHPSSFSSFSFINNWLFASEISVKYIKLPTNKVIFDKWIEVHRIYRKCAIITWSQLGRCISMGTPIDCHWGKNGWIPIHPLSVHFR